MMEHAILLLTSIAVGMIIGLISRSEYKIHGPNAKDYISKTYQSKKNKKCYNFNIKLVNCK